jgi:prevent-host-death family protein
VNRLEIGVRDLRENLRAALEHVKAGGELVITERGTPIARIGAVDGSTAWNRLEESGVVGTPARSRPRARAASRVRSRGPVSPLVSEQRR